MGNPFYERGLTYFQLPQSLAAMGILQQLTGNELCLYVNLCYEAHIKSRKVIVASGVTLARQAGISVSKIGTARRGLVNFRLIRANKAGTDYQYILCDPQSGLPLRDSRASGERFDLNDVSPDHIRAYFMHHLKNHNVADSTNGLEACCPFHDDGRPSFSVTLANGGAWQCHSCERKGRMVHFEIELAQRSAGLTINGSEARSRVLDVLRRVGALSSTPEQPEAVYSYSDDMAEVVFEVLRWPGKRFSQRRPNGKGGYVPTVKDCPKLVYRRPEVDEARTVFVCEGEKDVDLVLQLRLRDCEGRLIAATCNSGGAGKWTSEHSTQLQRKRVLLLGDNDEIGQKHIASVRASLESVTADVVHVHLPTEFHDVSDFLQFKNIHDLIRLLPGEWLEEPAEI